MKPSNLIDRSIAMFQTSTVTYNEAGLTYNDSNTRYGGSDRNVDLGPKNTTSPLPKPNPTEVN